VAQDAPHFSWEIHRLDARRPDGEEVCSSVNRTTCELPISTPDRPIASDFIVYLHPVAAEVVYTGLVEIGYLHEDKTTPAKLEVNQRVPPSKTFSRTPIKAILSETVAGKPGTYNVSIMIVATMNGTSTTLRDSFAVTLRAERRH